MDILNVISSEAIFLLREHRDSDDQNEEFRKVLIELRRAVRKALNDEEFGFRRQIELERSNNGSSVTINSSSAEFALLYESSMIMSSLLRNLIETMSFSESDLDFSALSDTSTEYYFIFEYSDWYISLIHMLLRGRDGREAVYKEYSQLFEYKNKIDKIYFDKMIKDVGSHFESQVDSYVSDIKTKTADSVETALRVASNRTEQITEKVASEVININDAVKTIGKIKEWNTQYNNKMKDIVEQCETHKSNIDSIFLAANKQGMAQSFKSRARDLIFSMVFWFGAFFVSLSSTGVNGYLLLQDIKKQQEFISEHFKSEDLNARLELSSQSIYVRMMMTAPLLWLAWFAGRQFGHASKLRQDYIYKSAVAMAYQGYKVEATEAKSYMHEKLLENIVSQFSENPVRLYEKIESSTPLEEVLKKLSPEGVAEVIKALKAK